MMRWETLGSPACALVADGDEIHTIEHEEPTLAAYDGAGASSSRAKLPKGKRAATDDAFTRDRPCGAARFGDALLAVTFGETLIHRFEGKKPGKLASGTSSVESFGVSGDDVVVGRRGSLELWAGDGKRRWQTKGGPFTAVAIAGEVIAALDTEGALVFAAREDGALAGALRLASTEPAPTWHLAPLGRSELVLALGDWLVWIDAKTRKTIRRVRARAKVRALVVDGDVVVAGCEDGWVQSFRAATGEPKAAFAAHEGEIRALTLGPSSLFTVDPRGRIRAWDRAAIEAAPRSASPVTALAIAGDLMVVADKSGRVRMLRADREVGTMTAPSPGGVTDAPLFVRAGARSVVVVATSRVVLRANLPWTEPKPIPLRGQATAVTADDAYLFAGAASGTVDVFDLERGTYVTTYSLTDGDVTSLCRLPGAMLVVGTGALDGRIFVVDVAASKVAHRIEAHDEAFAVTALACDPRGRLVASGSDDGTIVLIDPAKGKILARLRVKETPASIAFESSGRRFACAFADGTAAVVSLGAKGAQIEDLGLRGASRVTWGDALVVGFKDGRVERIALRDGPASTRAPAP